LESDVESTASSPRGAKKSRLRQSSEMTETDEEGGLLSEAEKVTTPAVRHISAEVVPMGPPPPPKPKQTRDSTFMEKLHAVDEELASSPVCMDSFQVNCVTKSLRKSNGGMSLLLRLGRETGRY